MGKEFLAKTTIGITIGIPVIIFILWFGLASVVWGFQNPKANQYTVFTHFTHVMCFEKLDTFQ